MESYFLLQGYLRIADVNKPDRNSKSPLISLYTTCTPTAERTKAKKMKDKTKEKTKDWNGSLLHHEFKLTTNIWTPVHSICSLHAINIVHRYIVIVGVAVVTTLIILI